MKRDFFLSLNICLKYLDYSIGGYNMGQGEEGMWGEDPDFS